MDIKVVFYENKIIDQNDITENIFYKSADIDKDTILFLQEEMKIDNVYLANSYLTLDKLNENVDIVVNSDITDWINIENCITINTWNYRYAHFSDLNLLNPLMHSVVISCVT